AQRPRGPGRAQVDANPAAGNAGIAGVSPGCTASNDSRPVTVVPTGRSRIVTEAAKVMALIYRSEGWGRSIANIATIRVGAMAYSLPRLGCSKEVVGHKPLEIFRRISCILPCLAWAIR